MSRTVTAPVLKDWCSYAFVASQRYFSGLLVLLYSLLEQHRELPDCRTLTLIWHSSLADTVLQPAQRRAIDCLATGHGRRVDYLAADDARMRVWWVRVLLVYQIIGWGNGRGSLFITFL